MNDMKQPGVTHYQLGWTVIVTHCQIVPVSSYSEFVICVTIRFSGIIYSLVDHRRDGI